MPGDAKDVAGRRAVFFDRDGVLTELVLNPATGERESPHALEDMHLCDGAITSLRQLQSAGFDLFIVSNQPSYAKGKVGLETIQAIAGAVENEFHNAGVVFRETFYCFHHPQGIMPEYSGVCDCRKPSPHFLLQAAQRHGIDLRHSWMMGDRESDVECGRGAGCRTILIRPPETLPHQTVSQSDHVAPDVVVAAGIILDQEVRMLAHGSCTRVTGEGA